MNSKPKLMLPTASEFDAAAALTLKHRHDRQPATRGRTAALHSLHTRLAKNAALYETKELQDERDAVKDSLFAVQECLASLGFPLLTLMPLIRPVIALTQREDNILDPMFCTRARAGRPKSTIGQHERAGVLAAFAITWLATHKQESVKHDQQLRSLARLMKGPWFGTITGAALKAARDLVAEEAGDHVAVQTARMYEQDLHLTALTYGYDNAFLIKIRFLNDLLATSGAGHGKISKTPRILPSRDPV